MTLQARTGFRGCLAPGLLVRLSAIVLAAAGLAASVQDSRTFTDSEVGLTFTYPTAFGDPVRGSDHGFEERRAAIRFPTLNAEAVLTAGPVLVDFQAVSGLYDHFALQVLPEAARVQITTALPVLRAESFCEALASADHTSRRRCQPGWWPWPG